VTGIRCFLLQPIEGRARIWLRRYGGACKGPYPYHNAKVLIAANGPGRASSAPTQEELADPRWPTKCEHCDHVFGAGEERQVFSRCLYRRSDTGEETTIEDAPVGAMWDATWLHDSPQYCGPDGRCLVVKTPGGEWMIDSRARNCTLPDDTSHKCWIRHGEPPDLTVDKNGKTCDAGAGSIQCGSYHGFLRNGHLVPA
jgi:hypothetical protein